MCERKIWKEQDDQILKELFEVRKIRKWSQISRIMQEQYNITARNGKQCRERYHNHLRRGINKDKWTKQEELHLIHLHAQHGNRWALISKQIEGRTQNCVKNMLYSKLRKAIRQLNRFLFVYYRKEIKEIKLNFIYRLIQFTENAYKRDAAQRNDMEMLAISLKNQILTVQLQEGREMTQEEKITVKQLIQEIHTFKRKNQRFRGNLSGAGKTKPKPKKDQTLANSAVIERETKVEQIETENRYAEEQKQRQSTFGCLPTFNNNFSMKTTPSTPFLSAEQMQERKISKIGIQKMDSLQSNFSFHLADAGLQMPIQVDAQYGYVDPTGIFEEWGDLGNAWVPNFYY